MKKLLAIAALTLMSTAAYAETEVVTLDIEKMDCVTCPIIIKGALNQLDGVESVITSLDDRTAVVTFDNEKVKLDAIMNATKNVGFPAVAKESHGA